MDVDGVRIRFSGIPLRLYGYHGVYGFPWAIGRLLHLEVVCIVPSFNR
jgi:hypothetical protein